MEEILKIEFYNLANRGDVFCSRGVVKWVLENIPTTDAAFIHHFGEKIIRDLPLKYVSCSQSDRKNTPRSQRWEISEGVLKANVSYMVHTEYFRAGSYARILLSALKGELKRILGHPIQVGVKDIIPEISYGCYKLNKINEILKQHRDRKKIMVCNNDVNSGQAINFDLNPLIDNFSSKKPDLLFFITNKRKNNIVRKNVIYIPDIVEEEGSDLPEASYIGSNCNLILTRGSGPGTYSLSRENMNNNNLKFVGFCGHMGPMSFGLEEIFGNKFFNKPCRNSQEAISLSNRFINNL